MEYVELPLHCGGYIVNNHILSHHHKLPSPLETEVVTLGQERVFRQDELDQLGGKGQSGGRKSRDLLQYLSSAIT